MVNLSKHMADKDEWFSPEFSHVAGYKFCIGVRQYSFDHLSVQIYKVQGEHDDSLQWPRKIPITIQLWNYKRGVWENEHTDGEHLIRSRPRSARVHSNTIDKFLPKSELPSYLKDDSLRFRIAKIELK